MKPPVQRSPESLFIFLGCVALLLIIVGFAAATQTPAPTSPTQIEETK